jgi:transcriptional regulator with XRE-family HTH domain
MLCDDPGLSTAHSGLFCGAKRRRNMHMVPDVDSAIGMEISLRRFHAGLTKKDVAGRIGVTGAQFARYENGASHITTGRLVAIAKALNIRPETLLAAAFAKEAEPLPALSTTSPEITHLLQMFSGIAHPQHRIALVALARTLSWASQQQIRTEAVVSARQKAREMEAIGSKPKEPSLTVCSSIAESGPAEA